MATSLHINGIHAMNCKFSFVAALCAAGVVLFALPAVADRWTDPETGIEWTYKIVDGNAILGENDSTPAVGYGTSGSVTIPPELDGHPVTGVGRRAFYGITKITHVTFPEGVTYIANEAFDYCHLESVSLPRSLETIGEYAFYYNSSLVKVFLPDSVSSIGVGAFSYCMALKSVCMADSVADIGYKAFDSCSQLTVVTIPPSVTNISNYAFLNTGLRKVYVEPGTVDSVSNILASSKFHADSVDFVEQADFRVSFDANGGTCDTAEKIVRSGGLYGELPTPVPPAGYEFVGWFTDAKEGDRVLEDDFADISEDQTLYAQWVDSAYFKVTFDANEGECDTAFKFVERDTAVGALPEARRAAYLFDGWFTKSKGGDEVLESTVVSGPVTYYAHWTVRAERVDGISWRYRIVDGEAEVCDEAGGKAINESTSGAITIPCELAGCPVTSIGYKALSWCQHLTEVSIPGCVKRIGEEAFSYCNMIDSLEIAEGVEDIGNLAFYHCTGLGEVTIPGSVTNIGESAFYECTSISNVTFLTGVTTIGENAFCSCRGLKSVTMPKSVTSIGTYAFYGAQAMTVYVEFGDLERVKQMFLDSNHAVLINSGYIVFEELGAKVTVAFNATDGTCDEASRVVDKDAAVGELPEATLPGSRLEGWFTGKSGGEKVTADTPVSATVTYYAHWLENAETVDGVTWKFRIVDGAAEIYDETGFSSPAITGDISGEIVVPQTLCGYPVVSIGEDAFIRRGFSGVVIHGGVTNIGDKGFYYCANLKDVTIPGSVTSIGANAFYKCVALTNVTLQSGVTAIGEEAFSFCTALTSVTVPNSVETIGQWAFSATKLDTVYVEAGDADRVREMIETQAGYDNPVEYVDPAIAWAVVTFDANGGNCDEASRKVDKNTAVGAFPEATYPCYRLRGWFTERVGGDEVTADTVVSRGVTFYAQWDLNKETVDGIDWRFMIVDGKATVRYEGASSAAIPRSTAGDISIPPTFAGYSVEVIGYGAFLLCGELTGVDIPVGVTDIQDSAFDRCSSLACIVIPEGVTNIGVSAFNACTSLVSVTIPKSIESIGISAFVNTPALRTIYVASGEIDRVTELLEASGLSGRIKSGEVAFQEIGDRYTVTFDANGGDCDEAPRVVERDAAVGELPEATRPGYRLDGWFTGKDDGERVSPDTPVSATATYHAHWLVNEETVDGVTWKFRIVDGAAEICNEADFRSPAIPNDILGEIAIPEKLCGYPVASIGEWAFIGCHIAGIAIHGGVTNIENRGFYYCANLVNVTIPGGVTRIGAEAFYNCTALKSVTLPKSVETIGQWAFFATSLDTVYVEAGDSERVREMLETQAKYDKPVEYMDPAIARVVVAFDANGGAGKMPNQSVESGKVAKLNLCAFSPPAGKRFAGWRRNDNGRRYDDGILVFNLAEPGEIVTLVAIWE